MEQQQQSPNLDWFHSSQAYRNPSVYSTSSSSCYSEDSMDSPFMGHSPYAPQSKMRLKEWLIDQLDRKTCPGCEWLDRTKLLFKLPWKHIGKPGFNEMKDAKIFREWAIYTGRYNPNGEAPEMVVWKTRFRNALHKMQELEEMHAMHHHHVDNPYKVYRFRTQEELQLMKDKNSSPSTKVEMMPSTTQPMASNTSTTIKPDLSNSCYTRQASFQELKRELEMGATQADLHSPQGRNEVFLSNDLKEVEMYMRNLEQFVPQMTPAEEQSRSQCMHSNNALENKNTGYTQLYNAQPNAADGVQVPAIADLKPFAMNMEQKPELVNGSYDVQQQPQQQPQMQQPQMQQYIDYRWQTLKNLPESVVSISMKFMDREQCNKIFQNLPSGVRIAYQPPTPDVLRTMGNDGIMQIFGPLNAEQLYFPNPPEVCRNTQKILDSIQRGLVITVTADGDICVERLCRAKVFCGESPHVTSDKLVSLPRSELFPIFSFRKQFLPALTAYEAGGVMPSCHRFLSFGLAWGENLAFKDTFVNASITHCLAQQYLREARACLAVEPLLSDANHLDQIRDQLDHLSMNQPQ